MTRTATSTDERGAEHTEDGSAVRPMVFSHTAADRPAPRPAGSSDEEARPVSFSAGASQR